MKSFGEKLGIGREGAYDILKRTYLKPDDIKRISQILDVNSEEFIDYTPQDSVREKLNIASMADYFKTSKPVPYYDIDISAGDVTLFDDNKEIAHDYLSFRPFNDCEFAVNVRGDSMYPKYKSGDVIACKEMKDWKSFVQYGEVYLIVTQSKHGDSQRFIKFVRKSEKHGHLKMVSENPKHDPFDVPVSDIRKLYLVKGKVEWNQL
jgi:phage repressor protein C with HTH and peptisase S24 domain